MSKKEFTKEYILSNRGCYKREQVEALPCINQEIITLEDLSKCLPFKDFIWFFCHKIDLTKEQQVLFAIFCAELILHVYENKYPENKAPREAIQAAKDYLAGDMDIDVLRTKRAAAYTATAAYTAYTATTTAAVCAAVCAAVSEKLPAKIIEYALRVE